MGLWTMRGQVCWQTSDEEEQNEPSLSRVYMHDLETIWHSAVGKLCKDERI